LGRADVAEFCKGQTAALGAIVWESIGRRTLSIAFWPSTSVMVRNSACLHRLHVKQCSKINDQIKMGFSKSQFIQEDLLGTFFNYEEYTSEKKLYEAVSSRYIYF